MKETLKPGIRYQHKFVLPPTKTVPALYPEAPEFLVMPEVFATGFLVGFLEWVPWTVAAFKQRRRDACVGCKHARFQQRCGTVLWPARCFGARPSLVRGIELELGGGFALCSCLA